MADAPKTTIDGKKGKKLGEAATLPAVDEVAHQRTLTDPAAEARQEEAGDVAEVLDLREVTEREYKVVGEVARGGMGRILRARDNRHHREVALKEILKSSAGSRARFAREALITARLQHPGIVPVYEFASWRDGEPFYAMKLVEGRSLSAVLREEESLAGRLALLPKIIAAAEAIAYAHENGVIHRDLKPSNILVGEFGETVVIDWGLAKDLESDDDDIAEPSDSSSSELTVAGSVMGTPLYMPLEQAEGKELDERADVYALGAILYHLLAGEPPYRAETGEAVLELVRDSAPTPLSELDLAIPADLVTIIDKAMARRPQDRYSSGVDLAAELERFTTGQLVGAHRYSTWELIRRRLRRHRGALLVSAVAAAALVVVSGVLVQRIVAERNAAETARKDAVVARNDANDQRERAEGLVDFMLADLAEKLAPVGQMGLLRDVATRARAYAANGDPDTVPTINRQRQIASMFGNIRRGEGDLEQAEQSFREELELAHRAEALEKNSEAKVRVAQAHRKIADTLTAQGRRKEALAELERSRELLVELQQVDVAVDAVLGEVLAAEGMVKLLDEEIPGARLALGMADMAITAEWENNRDNPKAAAGMLQVRSRLADVELAGGNGAAALSIYDDVLTKIEKTAIPETTRAFMRAKIALKRGNALDALGKNDAANRSYREAAVTFARLSKDEPDNKMLVYDRSASLANQARTEKKQAASEKLVREAIEIMTPVAASSPEWQGHLGSLHVRLGELLLGRNKRAAKKELERGLEILVALEASGKLVAIEGQGEALERARKALAGLR